MSKHLLPLTDTYRVISIQRPGIETGVAVACQNCGKVIVNTATIQNAAADTFTVGLDCLKTLAKISNKVEHEDMLWSFNAALKFWTLYKKAHRVTTDTMQTHIWWNDDKGKPREQWVFTCFLTQFGFMPKQKI